MKNQSLVVCILFFSADPLQDLALSVDSCTYVASTDVNLRLATVLRHTINELSVDLSLTINGQIVPLYSKQLWPVSLNMENIPQGEFNVTAQLFNEDHHTIICADFYISNL
ncbi:hypothetical protein E2320_011093 [Naja naja]|nr:hypothetical protein E2320_011093 [Naja naja]